MKSSLLVGDELEGFKSTNLLNETLLTEKQLIVLEKITEFFRNNHLKFSEMLHNQFDNSFALQKKLDQNAFAYVIIYVNGDTCLINQKTDEKYFEKFRTIC